MSKKVATTSIILSVIGLLADVVALAQLSYSIIVEKQTSDVVVRFVVVILVFLLGVGLGSIGLHGSERDRFAKILRVYVWAYLVMACFTYLAIVIEFRTKYTFAAYISYLVILLVQIGAFMALKQVSRVETTASFPLVLMTISLVHALILLYQLIYRRAIPETQYVVGEMLFWLAWTLFPVPLLVQALRGDRLRSRLR